ncbi:hypothetical protein ACFUN5_38070 [Streptomyces sp. NPDC057305]
MEHTTDSVVHATVSARGRARLQAHTERLTAEVSDSVEAAA